MVWSSSISWVCCVSGAYRRLCRTPPSCLPVFERRVPPRPDVALRDLEEVAGRVLEVEGAGPCLPYRLLHELDAVILEVALPVLVLPSCGDEARVSRPAGRVR